jgi:hypothetical protein
MTTPEQEIRRLVADVIGYLAPLAHGAGPFPATLDVRYMIAIAITKLETAEDLARRLAP